MADQQLLEFAQITSTDGTEFLYGVKAADGIRKKINIDTICIRAASFVSVPEVIAFQLITVDGTVKDLTLDGSGTFSGSNGATVNFGSVGATAWNAQVIAYSETGEFLHAVSNAVASYDDTVPTAEILGLGIASAFTVIESSAGASGWAIETIVDPTTMQVYFEVTGDPTDNVVWGLRFTPVRVALS